MAKKIKKAPKPKAETPKGFRDYFGPEVIRRDAMLRAIGNSRFAIYHHVIRRRADISYLGVTR